MPIGGRQVLGLAVHDRELLVAQLRPAGPAAVTAVARLPLPPPPAPAPAPPPESGLTLEQPAEVGARLHQVLREAGITARRVVIGVPALWVMGRRLAVPPAEGEALAGVVRLQTERSFATDPRELVFDYLPAGAGDEAGEGPRQVLLLGASRRRIEQVLALAKAAGLTVEGVTVSAAVLGLAAADPDAMEMVVHLGEHAVEWSVQEHGTLHLVRQVGLPAGAAAVGPELRRAMATDPAAGQLGQVRQVRVFDALGLSQPQVEQLGVQLGLGPATAAHPERLAHVNGSLGQGHEAARFAPAIALARAAGQRQALPVDFLHSRLSVKPRQRFGRGWRIAALVVLLVAGGLGALAADLYAQANAVKELRTELAALDPTLKTARAAIARTRQAEGWFDHRPAPLDCLRELSEAFPDAEIWTTDLSWQEDGAGNLTGRAADSRAVLELRDRLQNRPSFQEVRLLYLREAGRGEREIGFSLAFIYRPAPPAPATPAPGSQRPERESSRAAGLTPSPPGLAGGEGRGEGGENPGHPSDKGASQPPLSSSYSFWRQGEVGEAGIDHHPTQSTLQFTALSAASVPETPAPLEGTRPAGGER